MQVQLIEEPETHQGSEMQLISADSIIQRRLQILKKQPLCYSLRTGAPMAKEPQAIDFKELLHKANLRATPARLALLRVLQNTGSPQTHAFLADALEELGIDKATVFRNLNSLVEIGAVRRLDVGDHVWRYEWLGQKQDSEHLHPHFVCTSCGEVDCLESDQVRFNDRSKRDLAKRTNEIVLRGTCKNCDEQE